MLISLRINSELLEVVRLSVVWGKKAHLNSPKFSSNSVFVMVTGGQKKEGRSHSVCAQVTWISELSSSLPLAFRNTKTILRWGPPRVHLQNCMLFHSEERVKLFMVLKPTDYFKQREEERDYS